MSNVSNPLFGNLSGDPLAQGLTSSSGVLAGGAPLPPITTSHLDAGDHQPDGGYIAPLLPPTYYRDPTNLLAYVAPFDAAIENRRGRLTALYQAHVLAYAQSADLYDIGARYGLYPLPNEDDDAFRIRIPATVAGHVNPTSKPGLQATLALMTSRAVAVTNQATPGRFLVVFEGMPPQGLGIVPLIAGLAAGGYQFDAVARAGTGTADRLGQFRLGSGRLGGGDYVTLTPRLTVPQVVTSSRLGQFRLGNQRLGA